MRKAEVKPNTDGTATVVLSENDLVAAILPCNTEAEAQSLANKWATGEYQLLTEVPLSQVADAPLKGLLNE